MSETLAPGSTQSGSASTRDADPVAGATRTDPSPFARYPHGGRIPFGKHGGDNARRGYGRRLHLLTGERRCAYCGLDLYADYERWLLLQVDHVVPTGVARQLAIPVAFTENPINLVLACAGCNGFDNRYIDIAEPRADWDLDGFLALRDATFAVRFERIAARRAAERAFFDEERRRLDRA